MIDSGYNRGVTSLVHENGQGCRVFLHVNDRVTLDDVMSSGFFDLANRNRGAHPWMTPGNLIDVDAFDGYVRLRIMSMDDKHQAIKTLAVTPPTLFDDQPKTETKRKPGRPSNAERAARDAAVN